MNRSLVEHEFQPDLTGALDPYRRLGLDRVCTLADIKRAWRKAASLHHPDKGGDRAVFDELRLCYDTLRDPERRRAYDERGEIRQTQPDTLQTDAMSIIINAFEAALQGMMQGQVEPRNTDMVIRIKDQMDQMQRQWFKERDTIKEAMPEWKAIAKRFRRRKGENFIARHIENKLRSMGERLTFLDRHLKAFKVAAKIIAEYEFDWERPPTPQTMPFQVFTMGAFS